MEIISNCCGAPLHYIYEDLCGECLEHCDPINLEEDDQPAPITRERIEEILKKMNVI